MDTKTQHSRENQSGAAGFALVSELLGTMFFTINKDILVKAESQDFIYDRGTGLKTGRSLKVSIEHGNVGEIEEKIEIILSGTVENHLGHKETCTLYFFMWRDKASLSLSKKTYKSEKTIELKTIVIKLENNSGHISDSVFKLDLYQKTATGQDQFFGQGRGYLVFDRET
jgi:hypothetical protein